MEKQFRRFGVITIISVLILIFVGGLVRATGSGMGCPDWPKCFGMWIPPTSIQQLPYNYQAIFGEKLKGEVIFNPIKTWIEYCNRLVGVSIGIFIFITFILSYRAYFKTRRVITILCFIAWILVGFEGWLGAKVVSSELHPLMITIHMFVSLIILGILIYAILKSLDLNIKFNENVSAIIFLIAVSTFLSLGQIIFGTQIREGVDIASKLYGEENRNLWLNDIMGKVWFHGVFAMILLGLNSLIYFKLKNFELIVSKWAKSLVIVTIISVVSGAILGNFNMLAYSQPIHLTAGVLIISNLFVLYFLLKTDYKIG